MSEPGPADKGASGRLAEINRAITTSLNFDEVLDLIVENAAQLVDARVCLVLLMDLEEQLRIRAARGVDPNVVQDFSGRMEEDVLNQLQQALTIGADEHLVSVPVIDKQSFNGLLVIVREQPISADERWQLCALADQAAIALRNARLYEMEMAEVVRARDVSVTAQQRLAAIIESSDDAIVSKDLSGIITSWNNGARRLFGYDEADVIGKPITILIPDERQDEEALILSRVRRGERIEHFETVRLHKDGHLINISLVISPIKDQTGKIVGASKIARDITERKKADEQLRRALEAEREARAEAEKANRLKDEFLATLSHELRNPLNVVIGYAEILRRSEEFQENTFVLKAAETIRRNALAQAQLVSDLLDLSRLQMGKLSLNRQPVSFSTVISDAIETVRTEAIAKRISLDVRLDKEVLVVEGDPIRLGQIAWNLLNNAVKFTPAEGKVRITLSREDDYSVLAVEDSGQGISPEFLPHVFEIFRQADASIVRRQGGMGIGLALVRQLAELHGGDVKAESDGHGKGARFTVKVPLYTPGEAALPTEKTGASGALKSKFILVVDDSPETTEMLGKLLELEGAFVDVAKSGKEALEIARQKRFDLVVSDISMPEMDGYQLLRSLRELPDMADLPVVALTGYGRNIDIDRARDEGFAEHLTKPLDLDKLLQIVRRLTD
jgi:two-component system CheB/CheR fusion protein